MKKYLKFSLIVFLGMFSIASQSGQLSVNECVVSPGITIDKFKKEFSIFENPKFMYTDENRPKHLTDQQIMSLNKKYYRFNEFGIWAFFEMSGKLKTIRIEAPFSGSIGGVYIGDSKERIFEVKGKPERDDANGIFYRSPTGYINFKTMRGKVYQAFSNHCE